MVTVTSATSSAPVVFPLKNCDSGTADMITFGCLATSFSPATVTYAWTKNGADLTDFIQYPAIQKGNTYTGISQIQVRRQDVNSKETYRCTVTNTAGNGHADFDTKPPHYQLPTLKVLASSDEAKDASFSCFAKDFTPVTYKIKWLKNDADITKKTEELSAISDGRPGENGTLYSAASFLSVPHSEWGPNDVITCLFEGKGQNIPQFVNSSVSNNPIDCPTNGGEQQAVDIEILEPALADIFLNGKGKLTCQVQVLKPSVTRILWEDERGNEMISSSTTSVTDNKKQLTLLLDITYEEWNQGVTRLCVVEHSESLDPIKKLYERRPGGQTQRPSVFMLPPVEHTRKEMVTLTCFVKDFFPKDVYVSWLVDDVPAGSEYEFHTTNPITNQGSYSVYSQLMLSLAQWSKADVVYSCAVHHQSVANTTKAIVRSIGYRTFEKNNLVNLNLNVPETCKA